MIAELRARGLLGPLDVELARSLTRFAGDERAAVELAIALTSRSVRMGHTCFPVRMRAEELLPEEASDAWPEPNEWAEALRESPLLSDGALVLDGKGRLYLRRYWELENGIALELGARARASEERAADPGWLAESLDRVFGAEEGAQREAAGRALRHRVTLLCGGPGTGKTTTLASIAALLVEARRKQDDCETEVLLIAPTGKSAARLSEAVSRAKRSLVAASDVLSAIPEEARTVQQALGMRRYGMSFRHDKRRPLSADLIILDEASMIDLSLMHQLLEAAPREARLIVVGDPDQLTSVEAGSVLRDLVEANERTWWQDHVTRLTKTYRYDIGSGIGGLLDAIRNGDEIAFEACVGQTEDPTVVWSPLSKLQGELDVASARWRFALAAESDREHFTLRNRFIVLTPFRKGRIGTERLGETIRRRLVSSGERRIASRVPIIVEENDRELGVFNGDFGLLRPGDSGGLDASLYREPDDVRRVAESRLPRYSGAYALSVHKAQGSEFEEVMVVFPEAASPLLTRELLYTAVSRARKRVRLVGPKQSFIAALKRRSVRHSGLVDAIDGLTDAL